jgi:hypothetical protein
MDCVKSLANMGRTLLGLFGTYEGIDLIDLSDQLMLRTKVIHLRRYGNDGEDFDNFESTIHSFQIHMPLRKPPDLLKHSEYLYDRTLGCIGSLRNWLLQAYKAALEDDAPTLNIGHLKKHAPLSAKQAGKMLSNLIQDELKFVEIVGEEDVIDRGELASSPSGEITEVHDDAQISETQPTKVKPPRKRRLVGERKPVRDPIGRGQHA